MKVVLLVSSIASFCVLAVAAYRENFEAKWRFTQHTYKGLLVSTSSDDSARRLSESFPIELRQFYLPKLDRIDRCTTCHLGVENPAMRDAAEPLRLHPDNLLADHPPDKFGCTICHAGEGRSTDKPSAHGWYDDGTAVADVDSPMLRGRAVYTSCGRCHYEIDLYGGETDLFANIGEGDAGSDGGLMARINEADLMRTLPRATELSAGKRMVVRLGCLGCHKYRGRGGVLGFDLTYVGDKIRHDFDFGHVKGEHTVEQWLYEHFMFPREVSPGTVMPDMGLSPDEARSLALYMMSLHRKTAPASHTPQPARHSPSQAESTVRGETMYGMFCSACHGPEGHGSTMRAGFWAMDADPWGRDMDARNIVIERRDRYDVMVPSLNHPDTLATVSDDYLRRIIAHGRPGTKMIGWKDEGGLSDDEVTLLVSFIRGWQSPPPDLASVSASDGNVQFGGALYRANCAACHGSNGEGGIGNSLNSPTFLAAASDAFLRDTIAFGRPNTAMPAWRDFSARELSDLLAFIRQLQPARSDVATAVAMCEGNESLDVSAKIGGILYNANCVACHGVDGSGDLGPSLNTQAFLTVVPDDFLVKTIIRGRPGTGMPAWRYLSNADVASIVRFLRGWQRSKTEPDPLGGDRILPGDWDTGRHLFAGQCAGCHGVDGEGATGPQLNNRVFADTATDAMLRAWITYGKEGTAMRGFLKGGQGIAELSARQIEDIIAYVRLLQRQSDEQVTRVAKSPNGRPELGASVYASSCSSCHGVRGEGASGPALSNPNFLRFASDGFLMATMATGRQGTEMRPVKRGAQSILELSSDELNNVVAYLRSWETNPPFGVGSDIAHRFVIPWNLAKGETLFHSYCSGCHGVDGKGLWAPELNNDGFLAAVTDGTLEATIVRGRRGTAMRPFGRGGQGVADLNSEDIDNIVAYIRHWSVSAPSPMTIPAEQSNRLSATSTADAIENGSRSPQFADLDSLKKTRAHLDGKSAGPQVAAVVPHRMENEQ